MAPGASQIGDVYLAFGGNRPPKLQGHEPRHCVRWQHMSEPSPATHIWLLLTTLESPVLHSAHILLLLFLFHLSTTYLFIFVVSQASGCLKSSQEWFQECYVLNRVCVAPGGGHLRLVPCQGPMMPDLGIVSGMICSPRGLMA